VVSKSQIKLIKSLGLLKFRQKYDKFTAEGEKTVIEFLKHGHFPVQGVFIRDESLYPAIAAIVPANIIHVVSGLEMEQMSSFKTPSPVLALFEKKEQNCEASDLNSGKSIYLDDIQDPGNMGTIIRIADWFGIPNIIRSPGSADFFNPKVIQSSMGSFCRVKTNTAELETLLKGMVKTEVLGAVLDGQPLSTECKFPPHGILIIGNEGHGISPAHQKLLTKKIYIPGNPDRLAESLNAAMACSIICHHWSNLSAQAL
jgi:TrmH family RNA methyltransferase